MNITLCIICKDEERTILRCINSARQMVNEIIVVDTGSIDQTKEIVRKTGATLLEIKWENDFAKARNYAIDHSHGEWIIFLDADEYFNETDPKKIIECITRAKQLGNDYLITEILNLGDQGIKSSFKTIRVFKNRKIIRYAGRIHEKLVKKKGTFNGYDCSEQIKIYHDGYIRQVEEDKNKSKRNETILLEVLKEEPNNSDINFYLMQEHILDGNDQDLAWQYGISAVKYNRFSMNELKICTYVSLLRLGTNLKKDRETIDSIFEEAVKMDQYYPDIEFRYALYLKEQGDIEECIEHLEECFRKADVYKGYSASIITTQAVHILEFLGACYSQIGRYDQTIRVMVKILRIDPYRTQTLVELIERIKNEKTEDVGNFLCKIYNRDNTKDMLLLLMITKKLEDKALFSYFYELVSDEIRSVFVKVG